DRRRRQTPELRTEAHLTVHRPSACSGVKACPGEGRGALRNTSDARRQAAKLCYRFGPLTPSARSANLIAGDGTWRNRRTSAADQARPVTSAVVKRHPEQAAAAFGGH